VRGEQPAVRDCLARVAGVRSVTVEPDAADGLASYVVDVGAPDGAEALAAAVVAGGFGLLDLSPASAVDLETLFLGLTSVRGTA
jgi:hypothetical protein